MTRFIFLSQEYMEEASRRTRNSAEYQQAAAGFDDTLVFVAEPESGKAVFARKIGGIFLPDAHDYWIETERPATFTFTAPYGNYVEVMTGGLDPLRAVMLGKLRLKGPMPKLLRYVKGTYEWIKVLRSIPTEFEGHYASRSFD
ncbi:MAG: SCP2 sterol-binding domain-containing protein [Chloroflexi bacterium]|nr:SCP2 sterol-binding domain-containing protein [Chloroflexota bacterium]